VDDWKLEMSRVLGLASQQKIVIAQTGIDPANTDERWFVVGAYLLTKGPRSYLNMIHRSSLEWYPEYGLNLGSYAAPPKPNVMAYWKPEWKVFVRSYARGIVLVNPDSTPVTVPDPGPGWRVAIVSGGGAVGADGKAVGTLTFEAAGPSLVVPAHSARVLIRGVPQGVPRGGSSSAADRTGPRRSVETRRIKSPAVSPWGEIAGPLTTHSADRVEVPNRLRVAAGR
jgi:hypothetical protein